MATRDRNAPIGVYDSGVGGLSILRALRAHLPAESYYYVADSYHCPYGDRSAQEIIRLAVGVSRHLVEAGCKLIVVACNTISSIAAPAMREQFADIPIVAMVPAVKPAVEITRSGVVGVLATQATVRGPLYLDVLERFAGDTRVISQPCPGLVDLIEAGRLEAPETEALLRRCLQPIIEAGADVIVLGCSHYPFVRPLISRIVGSGVHIIEPSDAIAAQTRRILEREGLLADGPPDRAGSTRFATTGDVDVFSGSVLRLVGERPEALALVWENGMVRAHARVSPGSCDP